MPTPRKVPASPGWIWSAPATCLRKTMTEALVTWGGWEPAVRDDPFDHFAQARTRCPVQRVQLADGHQAWIVLSYDAARQALNDPRISKDMLAALEGDTAVVAEGLPGAE